MQKKLKSLYFQQNKCPLIKSWYHYYCSILKKAIGNAKASYYNSKISAAKNKSKTSWNILRKEMGKLGSDKNISTLFKIDNVIFNSSQVANEFNNYFINVVDGLLAEQKNTEDASHFLHASFQQGFLEKANIPIMDTEIVHIINSINNKNSAGYGEILNKILELYAQYLSKPLTYVHNTSIIQGYFPETLKHFIVVPVFKNGDRLKIANYWPISLITSFSKIF